MILSLFMALAAAAQGGSRPLTAAERMGIESAVKESLNDPDSATFRHNPYRTGEKIYCGRVNAKNRFGGYVGYHLFVVPVQGGRGGATPGGGSGKTIVLRTTDQFEGDRTQQMLFMLTESRCHSAGYETGYAPVKVK